MHTIHRFEHGKNWNRHWGSNCAIMIRAATDMFVIYGCNSPTRWITRRLNCNKGQQFLEVFERGKDFEVYSFVTLQLHKNKYFYELIMYQTFRVCDIKSIHKSFVHVFLSNLSVEHI